ncbi:hypothetical protein AVEN_267863-1 [Araneus ventricosus]|uniref:Uncharacterized protein n=1 Tax=Araneus ventricosus TaxID=182803 RepID=A0A4Y2PJC7_ARAVE|nr:hypothetical protein AVEN_267863-1 [Araneus ventricosus]
MCLDTIEKCPKSSEPANAKYLLCNQKEIFHSICVQNCEVIFVPQVSLGFRTVKKKTKVNESLEADNINKVLPKSTLIEKCSYKDLDPSNAGP